MTVVFGVLIGVSGLLGMCFIATYGRPWRSENPAMAWLQSALAATAVALDVVLMLALLRVAVPLWSIALILLAQDAVFGWRLLWLAQTRHHPQGVKE